MEASILIPPPSPSFSLNPLLFRCGGGGGNINMMNEEKPRTHISKGFTSDHQGPCMTRGESKSKPSKANEAKATILTFLK
jgi:hypothetical protein